MKYTVLFLIFFFYGEAFSQQKLPNVIIVMADDMGYGDPSCYNPHSKIPTPNMDRLASERMIFWDGHSASSICTPSRYALITGRYPWRSRLVKSVSWSGYDSPLVKQDDYTIAKMMKRAGYMTGIVGKWHLGINFAEKEGNGFVQLKDHHHSGLKGSRNVDFTMPTFGGPNDLGIDYWFGSAAGHNMEPHLFLENRYTFIAYWPRFIQPNSESKAFISNMDFIATLAKLTGIQVPENLDSQSFYPLLLNPQLNSPRTKFVHSLSQGAFAYRTDQWKYIRYRSVRGEWIEQLFNLKKDPYEKENLTSVMSEFSLRMKQELDEILYVNQ